MQHEPVEIKMEELLDREKIRHHLRRYTRGMDRQDIEVIRSSYWPEAWIDHGMIEATGEEFANSLTSMWPRMKMEHLLGQSYIEVHDNFANVETYFYGYHRMGEPGSTKDVVLGGRYNDRLEKRGEDWRIIHRVVVYDWWRDYGKSEPWDGPFWNGRTMPARNYGSTGQDYSWELFANKPLTKSSETGSHTAPLRIGADKD